MGFMLLDIYNKINQRKYKLTYKGGEAFMYNT